MNAWRQGAPANVEYVAERKLLLRSLIDNACSESADLTDNELVALLMSLQGFSHEEIARVLEKEKGGPLTPAGSFSTASVASRAVRSLVELLQSLWVVVIWLGVWAPVWLFPLLLVLYAWHRRNRRRVQRTIPTPPDR